MNHWRSPLASILDTDELSFLAKSEREVYLGPRKTIFERFSPIDHFWLICLGSIRLERQGRGENKVIYSFKRGGDLLGVFAFLDAKANHVATAVTLESSKFLVYPKELFLDLATRSRALQNEIKRQISVSFQDLQMDRDMERAAVPQRLALVLLTLLERQKNSQNHSILLPLSKADLARRIGAEPETVIRILNAWSQSGILHSKDRIIEIKNFDLLKQKAREHGTEPNPL